jgi:glycosyltransferase involved in cell wall biosynthesis
MTAVSVIMPTFDKARYLELTLASFMRQTCDDFEIVVVDDGSRDDTAEVLAGWPDRRVRVLRQENAGRSAARNAAVAAARGEWVVFCDDDRLVAPDFLEAHLRRLVADPRSVVLGFKRRVLTYWRRGELPLEMHEWLAVAARTPGLATRMEHAERLLLCTRADIVDEFDATVGRLLVGDELDNQQDQLAACGDDLARLPMAWALGTTANLSVARRYLDGGQTFDERFRGWGVEDTDLCYRLHLKGLVMRFERGAVNYHQIHPLGGATPRAGAQQRSLAGAPNFRIFCEKFSTLESHLLWRSMNGLGLQHAQALLQRAQQDSRLRDEMAWAYREVLRLYQGPAEPTASAGQLSGQAVVGLATLPLRRPARTDPSASLSRAA